MSRRVYLLGIGIAMLGLAFSLTDWVIGPKPGITAANARRIRVGMTMEEVYAIVGCGPGTYSTAPVYSKDGLLNSAFISTARYDSWLGDEGLLVVSFNSFSGGRVTAVQFTPALSSANPFIRLRSWLGL